MDNKNCVMCKREALRAMARDQQISVEAYAEALDKIEWEIKKSPHRVRLVCSYRCYDEMRALMNAVNEELKAKRKGKKHDKSSTVQ